MTIQFACPNCGQQLRVPDSTVGQSSQCPKCQHVSEVSDLYERISDPDPAPNPYHAPPLSASATEFPGVIDKDSRTWAMAAHLLGLSGFIIPFGNVLGPLVIWLMKRDELSFVGDQAKESLNFQISMTLVGIGLFLLGFLTCGVGFFLLPLLGLAGLVFPVIAAIKANDGIVYRYPFILRLLN